MWCQITIRVGEEGVVRRSGPHLIWQLAQLVSPYVIVLAVSDDVELEGVVWYRTTLWE